MLRILRGSVKVLLADNDRSGRDRIASGLAREGYNVHIAEIDRSLVTTVAEGVWDVLIFDLAAQAILPQSFGNSQQPIQILLMDMGRPELMLTALEKTGADIWLQKPVHVEVLAASIANLLRRRTKSVLPHTETRLGEELNVWQLSPTNWTISSPDQKIAKLVRAETDFLLLLGREPGEAVSRDRLIVAMGHRPNAYEPR